MVDYARKTAWVLTALFIMAALSACGGSGGATVTASDTAPSYKGINAQARIKEDNASDLAFGGYAGGGLGSALGWGGMAKTTAGTPAPVAPTLLPLASALKESILQVMTIAPDVQRLQQDRSSAKVLKRAENFDVPGWFGGTASYTLEMDDAAGSFSGTVRYTDFATDRYTFSGTAEITGTVDSAQQAIRTIALSFDSLRVTNGYNLELIGSISWTFDLSAPSDAMAMNMVLVDQFSGKTYWFKDYSVKSTYGYVYITQDISGRYFHPDHGYVDFATEATIITDYFSPYPLQGTIIFSGSGRTSVRLRFEQDQVVIGVDVDGDNVVDKQEILVLISEASTAPAESGFISSEQSYIANASNDNDNDNDNNNGNDNNTDGSGNAGSNADGDDPSPMPDDSGPSDMTPDMNNGNSSDRSQPGRYLSSFRYCETCPSTPGTLPQSFPA